MELFQQLTTQLKSIWNRWNKTQRIVMVSASVLAIVSTLLLTAWASQQDYVPLSSQLRPADAHEIVSTLQAEGIQYELNFSGSTVSVPAQDLSRARIALKDAGAVISQNGDDPGDGGWFADPAQQKAHQQRSQERRIAASINQMVAVKSATVHITEGETSPFVRDSTPAKASVVLELERGASFTGADASAVVSLVSHAVENLDPENTMIVDTDGRVLSDGDTVAGDVTGQLDYKRRLESGLSAKAEAMLLPILGPGRAVVRVTADVDFTETNTARTSYDPDGKAKTRESITSEKVSGGPTDQGGAGITSNVGSPTAGSTGSGKSDIEKIETEYENSETVDTIREAPGRLTRLTVAAVVELPEPEISDADAAANAPAITKEQIESIIKQAVGFDTARDDQVEVLAAKMTALPDLTAPTGWATTIKDLAPLASSTALVLAAVVALMLGLKTIRKLKPVVVEVERRDAIDPEVRAQLAEFSEEIIKHPEAVSTVLAGWLADKESESPIQKRKAA